MTEDAEQGAVEVVVAHSERATLRVGDVFVKVDADAERSEREVEAMRLAPVPTAEVLWHRAPALALARLSGVPLGRLGEASSTPPEAWVAAGAVVRRLHEAAPPPWPSRREDERAATLAAECAWLVDHDVLPRDLVEPNRALAERALQPHQPVFVHGDLQVAHVFVEQDAGGWHVTGVLDWSEGGAGDAAYDLATLTLGHREHLPHVLEGYGDVDTDRVRAWWSLRSLTAIRWLLEHGFDAFAPGCEVDVLRSQL